MSKILSILFVFMFVPICAFAFVVPEKPNGFVQDYASILSTEEKNSLEAKLSGYEKSSTNEIAIVTIVSLGGDSIENISQQIFTKWGIGKKDKNNGVLILISLEDRQTRIHTGYGVEGDLTDISVFYIQDEIMTPAFRSGNYALGINGAVDKIMEALGGTDIIPENYSEKPKMSWDYVFILGFIVVQWLVAVLAKSKSWWAGGVVGVVIGVILMFVFTVTVGVVSMIILTPLGLLLDYFVSKAYRDAKSSGKTPPWFFGGGGFGGGSHGGGFGGFGGGMSGGGGASGRW